jgi:hypothetical protein
MKTLVTAFSIAAVAFLLIGASAVTSHGVCILNCPAGDGGPTGPGVGIKSPDINSDAIVDLIDLSIFAAAFLGAYNYCADYNCDGVIDLIDLSLFAPHWTHAGVPGFCQPMIDHYMPYDILQPAPSVQGPIILDDQFGSTTHTFMTLTKLATPADKNQEGMLDPVAHQTWYEFFQPEPFRTAIVQDQFGENNWLVLDSRFLVMPALKNPDATQELPRLNHYKCYDASGPFDPDAHMTCYGVDNPELLGFQVLVWDQFLQAPVIVEKNTLLCLPAVKKVWTEEPVGWNKIKALYDTD